MKKKKILIVDDEKVLADVVQEILILEGYEATTAYNGLSALDKFRDDKPDLVITDLMMPFMSGVELIKEIRKNPENNNVAIILTSSTSNIESYENEGWQKFIKKPADIENIIQNVADVLLKHEKSL